MVVAGFSALLPFRDVTEMVNIGTLAAFVLVAGGVLLLRRLEPDRPRPFRTPFVGVVAPLSIVVSLVLMLQLDAVTWLRFGIWMGIGLAIYFGYSRRARAAAL